MGTLPASAGGAMKIGTMMMSPMRAANVAYGVDTNWYLDTSATDHITGNLERMMVRDKYCGKDKVHTASGEGMRISHIG